MTEVGIAWSHGSATFLPTAGMLTRCTFLLPDGEFEPFARAPWLDSALTDPGMPHASTGHVRVLGGEFVGVPFGSSPVPADAVGWEATAGAPLNDPPHGPSAEDDWTLASSVPHSITMRLDYPESSPVSWLERTVSGVPGKPALTFRLAVHARRPTRLAVGLHPILRLPDTPGTLLLDVAFDRGRTYPGSVAGRRGASSPGSVEDVVQLCGVRGPFTAVFTEEGAGVRLDWDRTVLPSLLLWVSDRGIPGSPWNSTYRGLGVEPIAAAFDFPNDVSVGDNPIASAGHATSVAIQPGRPTVIDYSVSAFAQPPRTDGRSHEN